MSLSDLKKVHEQFELDRLIHALADPKLTALPDLAPARRLAGGDAQAKPKLATLLVRAGKRLAFANKPLEALKAFELAREFEPGRRLLSERIALLRHMADPNGIESRINLQELQRQFGTICTKTPCRCASPYRVADCVGIFGSDRPEQLFAGDLDILAIALYHSWSKSSVWSKLIKKVKHDFEPQFIPFMARIAGDLIMITGSRWSDIDVLVPVPPSPQKYAKRGFAPTDLIAMEVSRVLGIPARSALLRKPGPTTREATHDELVDQFSLDGRFALDIRGGNVLLVEDVVTTGRTVSICADKLTAAGSAAVSAFAMARSTRL